MPITSRVLGRAGGCQSFLSAKCAYGFFFCITFPPLQTKREKESSNKAKLEREVVPLHIETTGSRDPVFLKVVVQNRPYNDNRCDGGDCSGASGPSSRSKTRWPLGGTPSPPKSESKGAPAVRGRKGADGTPHLDVTRGNSRSRLKCLFGSWGKPRQGCIRAYLSSDYPPTPTPHSNAPAGSSHLAGARGRGKTARDRTG